MPEPLNWELQFTDAGASANVEALGAKIRAAGAEGAAAFEKLTTTVVTYGENGQRVNRVITELTGTIRTEVDALKAADTAAAAAASAAGTVAAAAAATATAVEAATTKIVRYNGELATMTELQRRNAGVPLGATAADDPTFVAGRTAARDPAAEAAANRSVAQGLDEIAVAEEKVGTAAEKAGGHTYNLGRHLQNLLVNQAAYAGLNEVTKAFQGFADLLGKPAIEENALMVYTRELGSATAAQQRFDAVRAEGLQVGIKDTDLLKLDERLAQLGITAETAQSRFGRSLPDIRRNLEDLANAPGMDITKIEALFTHSADGAQRLVTALEAAGLTTHTQLESMGVEFNKQTNTVISANDVVARALLQIADKYAGLAVAQGQTMDGMKVRTQNAWDQIGEILGHDIFTVAEQRQAQFLDGLTNPKTLAGLEQFGHDLGDAARIVLVAADNFGALNASLDRVQQHFQSGTGFDLSGFVTKSAIILPDFSPLFTALHDTATATGTVVEGFHSAGAAAADFGTSGTTALDSTATAAENARTAIAGLQTQLSQAQQVAQQLRDAQTLALTPLQDALSNVGRTETARNAGYTALLTPLQDQLAGIRATATAAGQAAADAVAPYQAQLAQLSAASSNIREKYAAEIQPLKDKETALDRIYQRQQDLNRAEDIGDKVARDRALSVDIYSSEGRAAAGRLPGEIRQQDQLSAQMKHADAKQGLQDEVTALERAQAVDLARVADAQRAAQAHITAINAARSAQARMYQEQESAVSAQIRTIQDAQKADQAYFASQKAALQEQIDQIKSTYGPLITAADQLAHTITQSIHDLQNGATTALVVTQQNAQTVLQSIASAVALIQAAASGTPFGVRPANVGAGSTPPGPGQPGFIGPVFIGPTRPPGRAGGGPVSEGWFTVGENGPEYLHAAGAGAVVPGGNQTITIIMQDPGGREWFRQVLDAHEQVLQTKIVNLIRGSR